MLPLDKVGEVAAAAHARQHHQPPLGYLHVDVLQVVLLRVDDFYVVLGHNLLKLIILTFQASALATPCLRQGYCRDSSILYIG